MVLLILSEIRHTLLFFAVEIYLKETFKLLLSYNKCKKRLYLTYILGMIKP